jgi:hypothetical protein
VRLVGLLALQIREFRNLLRLVALELLWDSALEWDKQAQIPTLRLLQPRPGNRSGVEPIRAPTTRTIGVDIMGKQGNRALATFRCKDLNNCIRMQTWYSCDVLPYGCTL